MDTCHLFRPLFHVIRTPLVFTPSVLNYPARGTGQQGAIFGPSMFPKLGSLQHFVRASDVFEDLGPR